MHPITLGLVHQLNIMALEKAAVIQVRTINSFYAKLFIPETSSTQL
jgi:hypothetical protein